jgi:hypothetical protein
MQLVVPRQAGGRAISLSGGLQLTAPRRGTFTPASVSGLLLWLAADSTAHLWQDTARTVPAVADGDPVACWDDGSGVGHNVVQATTTKRPLLKLAILNSKPVLRFDGVDDFLQATFTAITQPFSRIAVFNMRSYAASSHIYGAGPTGQGVLFESSTSPIMSLYDGTVSPSTSSLAVGTFGVVSELHNGAASELRVNGAAAATGNPGVATLSGVTLSAASNGASTTPVDHAEVVVYNRALTTAERQSVERYLGTKYGITVS